MPMKKVEVQTPDGAAEGELYIPTGKGPWTGVTMYTDILGIRPGSQEMARRLAEAGYVVLLPNLFYRGSKMPIFPFAPAFGEEKTMARVGELRKSLTPDAMMRDVAAHADFLFAQAEVKKYKLGAVGYCMGGNLALRAAAASPAKVGAAASFHGSNLVTGAPDSPHLLAPGIKAHLYFGFAVEDKTMPPEAVAKLRAALDAANVSYEGETYEGARHGWMVPDHPMYNAPQSDRAWKKTLSFLHATLR